MAVSVKLIRGKHGSVIPSGLTDMLEEFLALVPGLSGEITVNLGIQLHGAPSRQGIKKISVRSVKGRVINIALQPGGNDTCREVRISVPNGLRPEDLAEELRKVIEDLNKATALPVNGTSQIEEDLAEKLARLTSEFEFIDEEIDLAKTELSRIDSVGVRLREQEQSLVAKREALMHKRRALEEEYLRQLAAVEAEHQQTIVDSGRLARERDQFETRRAPLAARLSKLEDDRGYLEIEIEDVKEQRTMRAAEMAKEIAEKHGLSVGQLIAALSGKLQQQPQA